MESIPANPDPDQVRRVELILQQLDQLPTLGAVAVKLLELTTSEDSDAQEVIGLVGSDPALAGKVLAMCRCNARGRASNVDTVERAVLLLGFDAVRCAVLSVQVFDAFDRMISIGGESLKGKPAFDRVAFWQHSLAVSVLAERIAMARPHAGSTDGGEASIAGLLHDLGVLALHVLLPASFDRVCLFTDAQGVSLDEGARRIIGLDTRTTGKRLAEHWGLPKSLVDVLWLSGQRYDDMPDLPHRDLIATVALADAMARQHYPAPAGQPPQDDSGAITLSHLGVDPARADELLGDLHQQVAGRAASLDLFSEPAEGILVHSISRANESLGRAYSSLRNRAVASQQQARTIRAIAEFHETTSPGQSIVETLSTIVRSMKETLGGSFFVTLFQSRETDSWELVRFSDSGRILDTDLLTPPPSSASLDDLADRNLHSMPLNAILPWMADYFSQWTDADLARVTPLPCQWGVATALVHNCPIDGQGDSRQFEALTRTWAAAVAAASQHAGARALGEKLAEANRVLVETQNTLAEHKTMAALGEIAAGAAHEMNNPLAIIAGRSQLLAERVADAKQKLMATQISEQAHRLSDMITALRDFAEPPRPRRREVDLLRLVLDVVQHCGSDGAKPADVNTVIPESLPPVFVDPDQISVALGELIRNASEAKGSTHIEVRVQTEPQDDRLKLQVTDNGEGLTHEVLAHAFDPFYSAKPAGRQPGLGLARVRRLVEAHGGKVELVNGPSSGAIATIWLTDWRGAAKERKHVA